MPDQKLIINARIVNEGEIKHGSVLIQNQFIEDIFQDTDPSSRFSRSVKIIDAKGSFLLPGVIDDQVHFREPGLTHKADLTTESRAAVAGGITSFMEMPNTNPQTTTIEKLDDKFTLGAQKSRANYSFYMGTTNDNVDQIEKVDPGKTCGIKVFMGASTGNMLVDNEKTLNEIFKRAPILVATHCEDETTIKNNTRIFKEKFGNNILPIHHPLIRSHNACFLSSSKAKEIALKHNTRLHILHLSTESEMIHFSNEIPLEQKRITGEVCVHHLWFDSHDYHTKKHLIKWNPAVKNSADREALWNALLSGKLDVVATDHAPHLLEEKQNDYLHAPSGGPLVQHSLQAMAQLIYQKGLPFHLIAKWMSHNPAILFRVKKRGFIRKGYFADLVILSARDFLVGKENILYKCGWSPFEGIRFNHTPTHTFINGSLVYNEGVFDENFRGTALEFDR